ncbi:MAG: hypothetical protein GX845_06065 [Erysipelothrix sp.]|nr:hypothetical protein [Erysipelothrix sp.]
MFSFRFITYFSIQHLKSASLLAIESQKIESQNISDISGNVKTDLDTRNKAFVTGSLFATVSFLEATIREILFDIASHQERMNNIPKITRDIIQLEWSKKKSKLKYTSTLEKYKGVLKMINKNKIDENSELYENLRAIIKVRHALIHYNPEVYSIHSPFTSINYDQFELTEFLDGKFNYSIFYENSGNPFFPDKCLSYGFASWALENALAFTDDFHDQIKIKPIYDHVRKDIII